MRIRDVVLWHSAIWLMAGSSVCALSEENPATRPITGTPGVVVSHGVVNFSELARQEALHPRSEERKVLEPEREAPKKKALPPGAIIKPGPEMNAPNSGVPETGTPPGPYSPDLASSFLAQLDNGLVIPPDTQGTVGLNHLMVTLNSNVVIQNRSGGVISTVSLTGFWQPATGVTRTTDPRVVYDPYNGRWIMTTSGDFLLNNPSVLVGVSQGSDPTQNWFLYKVAVDSTGHHFCDFPTLGFNKTWIVVMCNVFDNNSSVQYFSGNVYVFDKMSLYSHGAGTPIVLNTNGDSNVTPAITYDNNLATEYLFEEYNNNQSGLGTMRLWAISGPVGSPTLTGNIFPAAAPWDQQGTTANFAPQLGSPFGIATNDANVGGNVIYRNGAIWAAHTVFLPCCGSPNRSSIQWWQVDTGGNVLQRALIDNPDGSYFRAFPSIAVNQSNDVMIGYSRFSSSEYASGAYSSRGHLDPPGQMQSEALLKAGEASYIKNFGHPTNRWGDYSNTAVDPTDDFSFWTIQEYAAQNFGCGDAYCWGTWWGQIIPSGPPADFQITWTPPGNTLTAGVPLSDFAVTVIDAQGHRVTGYRGTVHFSSSDLRFSAPDYLFTVSDNGTHHFSGVVLFAAGSQTLTLSDAANSVQRTITFNVLPGPLSTFVVAGLATQTAGVPFNFTVTAQDAYQNTVQSYRGTVQFVSSDGTGTLPSNYPFNPPIDHGMHTFSATLRRAGTQTIITQDVASFGAIQGAMSINITPAPANHLVLGAPANVTRTKPFTLSVTAQDQFGNVDTNYSGAIQFTSSDGTASLPGNYTFNPVADHGRHYFAVTLNTLGMQSVTARDPVTSTIAGSVSTMVADLSGSARTLYIRLGQPFIKLIVANFSDDANPDPATLTATIDWGDGGGPMPAVVEQDPLGGTGYYVVRGNHAYPSLPEHPITVTVQDSPNHFGPITLGGTVRFWPRTESH